MADAPAAEVRAVTFDFWNTLLFETPGDLQRYRLDEWERILAAYDVSIPRADLDSAHAQAFELASASWRSGVQYRAEGAAAHMSSLLARSLPDGVEQELTMAFTTAGTRTPLTATPGIADALRELSQQGVRMGVVCDVGLTPSVALRDQLEQHGLLRHFDVLVFSDEVGVYKPDPAIFGVALAALDVEPAQAAHVGDLRRTDVAGALGMGMTAVRYTAVFDDPNEGPDGDIVIDHHGRLAGALGLAPTG